MLLALAASGTAPIGTLTEHLGCSRSNITIIADRLERDGWISRARDRVNRRVVHLGLTTKGRQLTGILNDEWCAASNEVVQVWIAKEIGEIAALLNKFLQPVIPPHAAS